MIGVVGDGRSVLGSFFKVVLVAAVFLVFSIGLVWAFRGADDFTFVGRLSEIGPNEPLYVEDRGLYIVHREGRVVVLDSMVLEHEQLGSVGRTEKVTYCPTSGLFEAEGGSKFDWRGRYYGGSAPTGLTTYPFEVKNQEVFVDLKHPIEGRPRDHTAYEPVGPFCTPV